MEDQILENNLEDHETDQNLKKRGGCLTAFLILIMVVNGLMGIFYIFGAGMIASYMPKISPWQSLIMGILSLAGVAMAILIFRLKRIGVYGYYVVAALSIAFSFYIGAGAGSLSSIFGLMILYIVIKQDSSIME